MNWFSQGLRKVHLLYVSPAWSQDRGVAFDAQQYASRYVEAGVETVELYCKDHHGVCYYPCSEGLPYPRNVVGELCSAVQARGMRFFAYFSVGFDNYILGVHPEWRATKADGVARRQPPFDWACLTSPYRDYALRQIQELVQQYPVDGLWLDIVPFAWDSPQRVWMQTVLPAPCYCMSCRTGFEAATGRPLPGPNPTLEERRVTYDFLLANVGSFIRQAREILERHRPGALLTYNGANGPGDPLKLGDLVSIEGHAPHYLRQSFIGRWARGLGMPFEVMTSGALPSSFTGWNGFDQKPVEILRVEAALAAIHGGSALIGQAPYANGDTEAGQYEGFSAAFQPLVPVERAGLLSPESMAEVAVVLSSRPSVSPECWSEQLDGAEAVHRALIDRHVQFDLLPTALNLQRYRLVILADQTVLSNEEVASICRYVADGGQLLAIGSVGLLDEQGKRRERTPLADLLGVEDGGDAGWPFSYLFLSDTRLQAGITCIPILINHSPRRIRALDATVLGDLVRPETARTDSTSILWGNPSPDFSVRQPGVTLRGIGSGRACWIPVSLSSNATGTAMWDTRGLEDVWIKKVVQNSVDLLLPDPILSSDAPPGVEILLNRHGSRLALHVVDTRAAEPIHLSLGSDRARPSGWTVRLSRARVGSIDAVSNLDGSPCEWEAREDSYLLHLGTVDLHKVLLLHLA